jgi:predicted ATPase
VYIDSLSSWQFYNANQMSLEVIRASEPKLGPSDRFLSASGDNLPLVFDNLSQEYLDFEETITESMREILPWTKKVRAIRSGRLGLVIEWSFQPPGGNTERFYLTEMSDGSVRMLSWAIALLSPEPAALLVIEEPEIGVHIAWMPALAKWIKQAANRTQLIVSTHSPDLLDQFTDMIPNVFVFQESSKRKNRFAIQRLQQERLSGNIEQGWQLGDLYRVGDPEVGGWPW